MLVQVSRSFELIFEFNWSEFILVYQEVVESLMLDELNKLVSSWVPCTNTSFSDIDAIFWKCITFRRHTDSRKEYRRYAFKTS